MTEKNIYVSYESNNNYKFFTDISAIFPLIPENVLFNLRIFANDNLL